MKTRFLQILKWTGISVVSLIILAIAAVYGLSEYRLTRNYNDTVPLKAIEVPHDSISVAEGKRLVSVYHCTSCHAKNYQGQTFLKVDMLATLISPNLTTSVPTYSDSELARLVRHAVKRDGSNAWMFASGMYTPITDADLGKMIGYLRTLKPVTGPELGQNWYGPLGRALVLAGELPIMAEEINQTVPQMLGQDTTQVGRGKYLTMTLCSGCHGGPELKGSTDEHMKTPALILVTAYKPDAFRHFLETGVGGLTKKDCGAMSMLCREHFKDLTDRESDAIYTFLQTLPNQKSVVQ